MVVREGGFRRAADRLHIAQPAVGRQIAALERELGTTLLRRTPRGVEPTEAGGELLVHATAWLSEIERTKSELREVGDGRRGRLSIGYTDEFLFGELGDRLAWIMASNPKVDYRTVFGLTSELAEQVSRGLLDCALVVSPVPSHINNIVRHDLATRPLHLLVPQSHGLAGRRSVRLGDVAKDVFIMPRMESANGFATAVMEAFHRAAIYPRIAGGLFPTDLIVNVVAKGKGVSLVSGNSANMKRDDVVLLELQEPIKITLSLLTASSPSNAAEEFANLMTGGADPLPS